LNEHRHEGKWKQIIWSSPKWVRYCVDDGYLWVYSLQEGENPRQAESAKFGEVQKIETGDGTLQC
jgi:hypothetical protein